MKCLGQAKEEGKKSKKSSTVGLIITKKANPVYFFHGLVSFGTTVPKLNPTNGGPVRLPLSSRAGHVTCTSSAYLMSDLFLFACLWPKSNPQLPSPSPHFGPSFSSLFHGPELSPMPPPLPHVLPM